MVDNLSALEVAVDLRRSIARLLELQLQYTIHILQLHNITIHSGTTIIHVCHPGLLPTDHRRGQRGPGGVCRSNLKLFIGRAKQTIMPMDYVPILGSCGWEWYSTSGRVSIQNCLSYGQS